MRVFSIPAVTHFIGDQSAKEAGYALQMFEGLGIAGDRRIMERQSRNTFENAEFSKGAGLAQAGRALAVSNIGVPLPRSIGVFRAAGFAVEPDPSDWRPRDARTSIASRCFPSFEHANIAVREQMGLIVYRLGMTDALFPGLGTANSGVDPGHTAATVLRHRQFARIRRKRMAIIIEVRCMGSILGSIQ